MSTRRVILLLAGLLLASPLLSQEQEPPEGSAPKDFVLPAKKTLTLDNGLQATLVPYGTVPKVMVRVVIRVGNLNEGPEEIWLADLMGDLLSEGTASRSAEELAAQIAALGGQLNIGVGADQTSVSSDVLGEFGADAIRILAEVIRHPTLPDSELSRLKDDMVRQLSIRMSQPGPRADKRFAELLYPNHPYGRLFPTEAMIRGYTIEQVRGFYEANFGAQRAHVYVAGVFDAAAVEQAIREGFADWARGPESVINPPKTQTRRAVHLINRAGAPQSTLRIGLPVIDPSHPDYVTLEVANTLLGGSFGSRITSNIREDKGYTYSPFSTVSTSFRAAHWVQYADVTTKDTGAAMREIFNEINRLQKEPPPAEELQGVQNYVAGVFVLQNSSRSGVISELAFLDLHELPESYLTDFVRRVHAVTPEEVQRVAKEYLRDETMTIVVVGDRSQISSQLVAHGDVVN